MMHTHAMYRKLDEYVSLGDKVDRLVDSELQTALGAPGEPGNAAAIVAVARKVAQVCRRFLEIRTEARGQPVDPILEVAVREFTRICDKSIDEFRAYPKRSLETLMNALANADGETEVVLHFEMKLTADTEPFSRELRRARRRL